MDDMVVVVVVMVPYRKVLTYWHCSWLDRIEAWVLR